MAASWPGSLGRFLLLLLSSAALLFLDHRSSSLLSFALLALALCYAEYSARHARVALAASPALSQDAVVAPRSPERSEWRQDGKQANTLRCASDVTQAGQYPSFINVQALLQTSKEYREYSEEQRAKLRQLQVMWERHKREAVRESSQEGAGPPLISASLEDDNSMYRFLKARKWDVEAAFAQYVKCHQWRAKHNVDSYRKAAVGPFGPQAALDYASNGFEARGVEPHPSLRLVAPCPNELAFRSFCSAVNMGYARNGQPVYLDRTGEAALQIDNLLKHVSHQQVIERHIRQQELVQARCDEVSALLRTPVGKQILIMDMKGLSFWPNAAGLAILKDCLAIDAAHYPETLSQHFLINCPMVFTAVWRLVSTWLDPVTKHKFRILGADYKAALLEMIDASQLPAEYGGTNSFVIPHVRSVQEARVFTETYLAHLTPPALTEPGQQPEGLVAVPLASSPATPNVQAASPESGPTQTVSSVRSRARRSLSKRLFVLSPRSVKRAPSKAQDSSRFRSS